MSADAMVKIDAIIEEIENYVASANRVPLTNKVMVKDDDLFHLMDKLRQELPKEVEEAVEICRKRDEVINDANVRAERIVEDATQEAAAIVEKANNEAEATTEKADRYAQKTVDENELKKQAEQQARALVEEAEAKAKQLHEDADEYVSKVHAEAEAYAKKLVDGAEDYAAQVVDHILKRINDTMMEMNTGMDKFNNNVVDVMKTLQQAKEQIHQANNHQD